MTNNELYLSFLKASNEAKNQQEEVTKRLAVGKTDLEDIAHQLKEKGASLDTLKKQIERASKKLNIEKLTLHKGKKGEKPSINPPKAQKGGSTAKTHWDKFLEKEFIEADQATRAEYIRQLVKFDKQLTKEHPEKVA